MAELRTPGVFIVEKNAFPNSVVEVATAVPAFVGYTRTAEHGGKNVRKQPVRISSMAEYLAFFGAAPEARFTIDDHSDAGTPAAFTVGKKGYDLRQPAGPAAGSYLLHRSMLHFFQNGGGSCYVVSVGGFDDEVTADALKAGIESLVEEPEPTMLVVPDAVQLSAADCASVQQAMLAHCGALMRNRVAILDIWGGARDRQSPLGDPVDAFRASVGTDHLGFAAAYYPWVHTTVVQDNEIGCANFLDAAKLAALIRTELDVPAVADATTPPRVAALVEALAALIESDKQPIDAPTAALLDKTLSAMSPRFNAIRTRAREQLNLLPPAAAMAGVYTMVDDTRGVWKAPANVSLASVVSPAVNLSHEEREDLNAPIDGKSINAIRAFAGEGVLVWGARTLDGNSLDWRYVNVRRTMIMLEQSCRLAAQAMVFEPNEANTWVTVRSMISNFLTGIWKRGGLVGSVPEDAFSVQVGLGETMTPQDVLDGLLRVTVLVAISRPAEFIEITFEQQMQAAT